MDRIRKRIILEAVRKHHRIFPVRDRRRLEDCFTTVDRQLLFWYNTEDRSTHVLTRGSAPSAEDSAGPHFS